MKKVLIEAELFLRLASSPGGNLEIQEGEIQGRAPQKKQPRAEKPGLLGPRFGSFVVFFPFQQRGHMSGLGLSGVVSRQAWAGPPAGGKPPFLTEKLTIKIIRRVSKRQLYTDTQAAG